MEVFVQDLWHPEVMLIFTKLEKMEDIKLARGALTPLLCKLLREFDAFEDWHLERVLGVVMWLRTQRGYLWWTENDEEDTMLLTLSILLSKKLPRCLHKTQAEIQWLISNNIVSSEFWNGLVQQDDFYASSHCFSCVSLV